MREAKTADLVDRPGHRLRGGGARPRRGCLGDRRAHRGAIAGFVARIAPDARVNSLGAKLVQLTMPGVADTYQGCELAGFVAG